MEADVNHSTVPTENPVIKEIKKQSAQLQNFKFPVRNSVTKHQFKRQSWILPEGQTVLEKEILVKIKKNIRCETPNIILYFDLFIILKQLLRDSLIYIESRKNKEEDIKLESSYETILRNIIIKKKKVNDLLELYIHQEHMREGADNLIESLLKDKQQKHSEISLKQIDECVHQRNKNINRLNAIQNELNDMSGTFKFHVLGLIGFSRVIPGDVYELSFKHSDQKVKSKCKITNLGQNWTHAEFVMKSNFSQDLLIKISEGGKVLGTIACSMHEFISSIAQVYLLPLNRNATLKLKLGILWSPIDTGDKKAMDKHLTALSYHRVDFSKAPLVNITSVIQRSDSKNKKTNFAYPTYGVPHTVPAHTGVTQQYQSNASKSPIIARNNHGANSPNLVRKPRHLSSTSSNSSIDENRQLPNSGSPRQSPRYVNGDSRYSPKQSPRYVNGDSRYSPKQSPRYVNGDSPRHAMVQTQNIVHAKTLSDSSLHSSQLSRSYSSPRAEPQEDPLSRSYNIPRSAFAINEVKTRRYSESSRDHDFSYNGFHGNAPVRVLPNSEAIPRSQSESYKSAAKNDIRFTAVSVQKNERNNNVLPALLLHKNGTTDNSLHAQVTHLSKVSPPPTKPKPKHQHAEELSITESGLNDYSVSVDYIVDMCRKIIMKLSYKNVLRTSLPELERKIDAISQLFQQKSNHVRKPSLTESISSALDSFDFLNNDDDSSVVNGDTSPQTTDTTKKHHLLSITLPAQWKTCYRVLIHHLYLINTLMSDFVPAHGPLVKTEQNYVRKMEYQLSVVSEIYRLINSFEDIKIKNVCLRYSNSNTLANTWEVSATQEQPLYCSWEEMHSTFLTLYRHIESESLNLHPEVKEKVCEYAMEQLTESNIYGYNKKSVVSIYQFIEFFKNKEKTHNVVAYLQGLQDELICFTNLMSKDDVVTMAILQQPHTIPITEPCIHQLIAMTANNARMSTKGASLKALYVIKERDDQTNEIKLIDILLQCLEEKNPILRAGGCMLLGKFKVFPSSKQLMYINEHDEIPLVKDAAITALKELGFGYRST